MSDALKQTGFADALNRLGLTEGAGSDGKLPNATSGLRLRRQAEDAKCVGVLDQWKAFNKSKQKVNRSNTKFHPNPHKIESIVTVKFYFSQY